MNRLLYLALLFTLPVQAAHISFSIDAKPPKGYAWERFQGGIPTNAISGGEENGRPLFICQANFGGAVHPGKLIQNQCNITFAGREIPQPISTILVGQGLHWDYVVPGMLPGNSVIGGYEHGQPLFVCQIHFAGGVHPGKIVAGRCNVGYGGREIMSPDYRVLVMGGGHRHRQDPSYYPPQPVPQPVPTYYSTSQPVPSFPHHGRAMPGYVAAQNKPTYPNVSF